MVITYNILANYSIFDRAAISTQIDEAGAEFVPPFLN